jgi:hypothetical protein
VFENLSEFLIRKWFHRTGGLSDQQIVGTDHPERASIPDAELTAINMPMVAQFLENLSSRISFDLAFGRNLDSMKVRS